MTVLRHDIKLSRMRIRPSRMRKRPSRMRRKQGRIGRRRNRISKKGSRDSRTSCRMSKKGDLFPVLFRFSCLPVVFSDYPVQRFGCALRCFSGLHQCFSKKWYHLIVVLCSAGLKMVIFWVFFAFGYSIISLRVAVPSSLFSCRVYMPLAYPLISTCGPIVSSTLRPKRS